MSATRELILERIRVAVADLPRTADAVADVPVPWAYGEATPMPDVVERFVERVEDYRAVVDRCTATTVAARLSAIVREHNVGSIVVPAGAPQDWAAALAEVAVVRRDDPVLSHAELNEVGAVVTGARVGIAETGTIVLDHGPDQGRRALSLVPDVHLCVIRADQVVSDVPEAVAVLTSSMAARSPQTWISGPSATSDIELDRVEGVHGPRTLVVLLVE